MPAGRGETSGAVGVDGRNSELVPASRSHVRQPGFLLRGLPGIRCRITDNQRFYLLLTKHAELTCATTCQDVAASSLGWMPKFHLLCRT